MWELVLIYNVILSKNLTNEFLLKGCRQITHIIKIVVIINIKCINYFELRY